MNFKVFEGCPSALGFKRNPAAAPHDVDNIVRIKPNTSMSGGNPIAHSVSATITLPALTGAYATAAVYFDSLPAKYAVVDFSGGKNQTVTFGFDEVSSRAGQHIVDNDSREAPNRTLERRVCPGSG